MNNMFHCGLEPIQEPKLATESLKQQHDTSFGKMLSTSISFICTFCGLACYEMRVTDGCSLQEIHRTGLREKQVGCVFKFVLFIFSTLFYIYLSFCLVFFIFFFSLFLCTRILFSLFCLFLAQYFSFLLLCLPALHSHYIFNLLTFSLLCPILRL